MTGYHGAALRGSTTLVWDRRLGEVWTYDPQGDRTGGFGRFGNGPGEFSRPGWMRVQPYGLSSWLAVHGDSIAVLDGNHVSVFSGTGRFRFRLATLEAILEGGLRFSRRIRMHDGALWIDIEAREDYGHRELEDSRPYRVWRLSNANAEPVLGLHLPPLPRDRRGAAFQSSREATPMWDLAGGCVVASDGSSSFLVVAGSAGVDSIPLPRSEAVAPGMAEEDALLERLGVADRSTVDPALPRRILDLIADPDGWVWIRPVGRGPGVRAFLVNPRTREVLVDTLPAFPLAFGPPGVFAGPIRDAHGDVRLHRLEAR
ncbi:MAG TPA: hypothetical protein VGA37_05380 [Gemmatimonadales bacterium]